MHRESERVLGLEENYSNKRVRDATIIISFVILFLLSKK